MKKPFALKQVVFILVLVLILSGCSLVNNIQTKIADSNEIRPDTVVSAEEGADQSPEDEKPDPVQEPPKPTGQTTLTINVVGDIMTHGPQIKAAQQADGSYDFTDVFKDVKPLLEQSDITFGNFETTVSTPDKGYGGYPRFRSPKALLEALKDAGFDVLTTANNHSFDGTEFGVQNTLDQMDEYGFLHTGSARSMEERNKVLFIDKNDIKVAVLAYTYGTNGMEAAIDSDKLPYMVNNFNDKEQVKEDVRRAREAGADIIIACMHWGNEYVRNPNEIQKEMADTLFSEGVDIIFGSHPHVLQPMERKMITTADGQEKEVFIIYSLGNFISNQRDRYRDSGIIVNLQIVKDYDQNTVSLGKIGYTPTWVYKYAEGGKNHYRIIPVTGESGSVLLQGQALDRAREVWKETTQHMGTEAFAVYGN